MAMVSSSIISASLSIDTFLKTNLKKKKIQSEFVLFSGDSSFKASFGHPFSSRHPEGVSPHNKYGTKFLTNCAFFPFPYKTRRSFPDSSPGISSKKSNIVWNIDKKTRKPHRNGRNRLVPCASTGLDGKWKTSLSYEQVVTLQAQEEESRLFRYGPPPGDVAEIEAFCRIYRVAEQLHTAVMDALRNLSREIVTQNVVISDDSEALSVQSERGDVPESEEKVVTGLAQIGAILHACRRSVLEGASHMGPSWSDSTSNIEDSLPPLALMRAELKDACIQLQASHSVGLE